MNVNSTSSVNSYQIGSSHHESKRISSINKSLLKIEKILYSDNEPSNSKKLELNSQIFGLINEIESILATNQRLSESSKKDLQILSIKFAMAAMKSGDTDWENFNLSKEVYENNESLASQCSFLPTLDEQNRQSITAEKRMYYWQCCQYNFAHNLIYTEVAAPADITQEDFITCFENLKKQGASESVATSAANAALAEKLCRNAFNTEDEVLKNDLFIAIRRLNLFYDAYINGERPEADFNLKLEARTLSHIMSFSIPAEIKERLSVDQ